MQDISMQHKVPIFTTKNKLIFLSSYIINKKIVYWKKMFNWKKNGIGWYWKFADIYLNIILCRNKKLLYCVPFSRVFFLPLNIIKQTETKNEKWWKYHKTCNNGCKSMAQKKRITNFFEREIKMYKRSGWLHKVNFN